MNMSLALPFEKLMELHGRQANNKRSSGLRLLHSYEGLPINVAHHQSLLFCLVIVLLPSRGEVLLLYPCIYMPLWLFLPTECNRSTPISVQLLGFKRLERFHFSFCWSAELLWTQVQLHFWKVRLDHPPDIPAPPAKVPGMGWNLLGSSSSSGSAPATISQSREEPSLLSLAKFPTHRIMSNKVVFTLNHPFWQGLLHGNTHQR